MLLLLMLPLAGVAQEPDPQAAAVPLRLQFVKPQKDHAPDSLYFNVLRIDNNTGAPLEGTVSINFPDGWSLVSQPKTKVNIPNGQSYFLPVRMVLGKASKGGQTYLINAQLAREDAPAVAANAYINIPRNTRWDITTPQKTVFFNRKLQQVEYELHITNSGNAEELIQLQFDVGDNLRLDGPNESLSIMFVPVDARSDTTLKFVVKEVPLPNDDERRSDWTKYTIQVSASSGNANDKVKRLHSWFRSLDSYFVNEAASQIVPLDLMVMAQNVVSDFSPQINVNATGQILMNNNQDISYQISHPNIGDFNDTNRQWGYAEHLWRLSRLR
ncbi:MAG: hypothetical protein AAGB22_15405, partial [Bacteroidota bacterium]